MQIGTGFWIQTEIKEAAANGVDIPHKDNRRQFFLSYHIKGVCNTHCGSQHLHIPLSQSKFGRLGKWSDHYCVGDESPPVQEVDTAG